MEMELLLLLIAAAAVPVVALLAGADWLFKPALAN